MWRRAGAGVRGLRRPSGAAHQPLVTAGRWDLIVVSGLGAVEIIYPASSGTRCCFAGLLSIVGAGQDQCRQRSRATAIPADQRQYSVATAFLIPRRLRPRSRNYRQHSYVATLTPPRRELVAVMGVSPAPTPPGGRWLVRLRRQPDLINASANVVMLRNRPAGLICSRVHPGGGHGRLDRARGDLPVVAVLRVVAPGIWHCRQTCSADDAAMSGLRDRRMADEHHRHPVLNSRLCTIAATGKTRWH